MLKRTNRQTVTKTVTSLEQPSFHTAGSLENSGAGEGNRTLVISLGSLEMVLVLMCQPNAADIRRLRSHIAPQSTCPTDFTPAKNDRRA